MRTITALLILFLLLGGAQAYEPNYKLWSQDPRCEVMYHTEITGTSLAWINWTTLDGSATGGVKLNMKKENARYMVMIVKIEV